MRNAKHVFVGYGFFVEPVLLKSW